MTHEPARSIDVLADPSGCFTMVALDQRESLRTLVAGNGSPASVADDTLYRLKMDAVAALAPHASALLLDRLYAVDPAHPLALPDSCRLILAADHLVQEQGGVVTDTALDPEVTPDFARSVGAHALKLLVIWAQDGSRGKRDELVGRFGELCRDAGLPGIVEGVVRNRSGVWSDPSERNSALVAAAEEFGASEPDLYKAEIPATVPGDPGAVVACARQITEALSCRWVVLSSGVPAERFPAGVAAACEGGASGFLAGRAIWADAVTADDPSRALQEVSVTRLVELTETVHRLAGAAAG